MRTATITEAKNGLSALIDRVRAGESVLITDRGVPVARLEPATRLEDPSGRLERLARAGLVRLPAGPPPTELLRTPPPGLPEGVDVVGALIEERWSGW
jgi:prevent-host-death family protein